MKLALATDGDQVAAHFGHCPEYTLADVEDGQVKNQVTLPNPGHQPGFLPMYLGEMKVTHVIAGGMGPKAQELFAARGITAIVGAQGPVKEVISAFISGKLVAGPSLCSHGSGGHDHGHGGNCGAGGCGGHDR
ncbi:MAG: NifB/NifX family molybdenum-iron cluster-binding protein [Candidatus Desulforudis sp.]|nr:NifB/NifX family molybdenum-iron cluster-binding protein [Desulforudis sp.]